MCLLTRIRHAVFLQEFVFADVMLEPITPARVCACVSVYVRVCVCVASDSSESVEVVIVKIGTLTA